MEPTQILLLVLLGITILLLLYFIWWTKNLSKPKPGKDCLSSGWSWNESCMYFNEVSYDNTLASPSNLSPYIIGFSYSSGTGNPLYLPLWYRFRYVNVKTGGYSDFSKWCASPVISGSCCLPCPGGVGNCNSQVPQGSKTCSYNKPIIGISQSDSAYNPYIPLSDGSFVYINLHRYTGKLLNDTTPPPNNTTEDEIIGYLTPGFNYGGVNYYGLVDVLNNPCSTTSTSSSGNTCQKPSWCSTSESTCDPNACSAYSTIS